MFKIHHSFDGTPDGHNHHTHSAQHKARCTGAQETMCTECSFPKLNRWAYVLGAKVFLLKDNNSFRNQKIQGQVGTPTPFVRPWHLFGLTAHWVGPAPSKAHTESLSPEQVTKSSYFTPFSLSVKNATSLPGELAVQFPSWFLFTLETLTPFSASQNESCVHTKPQQPADSLNPMKSANSLGG